MHHLEHHEGVIDEERVTADDRQIRKHMADGFQSAHPGNRRAIEREATVHAGPSDCLLMRGELYI